MHFIVKRNEFLKSLSHGQSVVERHTSIPILTHILIQAKDNHILLSTTDLEISLIEKVQAQIIKEGSIAVPAHTLHELTRKVPDGENINIYYNDQSSQVELTSSNTIFNLSCLPSNNFPEIYSNQLPYKFEIPAKILSNTLNKCKISISKEESRYYLNGIFIHIYNNKKFRVVSTDGHRLSLISMDIPKGAEKIPDVILPKKTILELLKLITQEEEKITVCMSELQINFIFKSSKLSSRLIDGTFPNYEKVIPLKNDKIILINTKNLLNAIDRVSVMAQEKERSIKIIIKDDTLKLLAASSDRGSASEEIVIRDQKYNIKIGFNAKYLIDILQQVTSDQIKLLIKDDNTAVLIKDLKDTNSFYVVMPMRI
jgi:DNA polymerase III subunit beta